MFRSLGKAGNSAFLQYNDNDWRIGNRQVCDLADGDCSKCEALIGDSRRLRKDVEGKEYRKDQDVDRQFYLRQDDLNFWRTELDRQVAALQRCNDLLLRQKTRLKAAAEGCDFAVKTCREVMVRRDARKGLDLVADKTHRELQKYLALLYDTVAVLERTNAEVAEQERVNRAGQHRDLRDMEDKFTAITIDFSSHNKCRPIGKLQSLKFNEELLRPKKGAVTMSDWESWTKHNIEKSDQEVDNSEKFRPLVEQILRQSYEDLDLQRRKVLRALRERTKELEEAQKTMDQRLGKINEQILEQKSDLDRLQLSRDDSFNRLELCQSRMEDRNQRPRMELVWDSVQRELEKEVAQLCDNVKNLDQKLREGRSLLKQMEQTQLGLQKQIEQKKDAIFIEQTSLNTLAQVSHCNY